MLKSQHLNMDVSYSLALSGMMANKTMRRVSTWITAGSARPALIKRMTAGSVRALIHQANR